MRYLFDRYIVVCLFLSQRNGIRTKNQASLNKKKSYISPVSNPVRFDPLKQRKFFPRCPFRGNDGEVQPLHNPAFEQTDHARSHLFPRLSVFFSRRASPISTIIKMWTLGICKIGQQCFQGHIEAVYHVKDYSVERKSTQRCGTDLPVRRGSLISTPTLKHSRQRSTSSDKALLM